MNPYLAAAGLIFVVGLMAMLPLVPALVELHRKSDAMPLSVVQQNAGEIRHFADSFRTYIKPLEPILQRCVDSKTTDTGALSDGEEYVVLGRLDEPQMRSLENQDLAHPILIIAGIDLVVPPEVTLSKEIYARGQFTGGQKNSYRAILGERNVHLGKASRILRWVHAAGEFTADIGCQLYGRTSSDLLIRLRADCSFLRMNAPRIEIGDVASDTASALRESSVPTVARPGTTPRVLHDGDFEILAGEVVRSNVVIRGNLHIYSGAQVCGSVKGAKNVVVEDGVSIEGSLISAKKMHIGPNCAIHGPVIAERELVVATGTRCGTQQYPTTVSAPRIELEEGVVVFGTAWARESGQVTASQ